MLHRFLLPGTSVFFAGLTIFIGYFVQRTDFQMFISAYAAFFAGYLWLLFYSKRQFSNLQIRNLIWLGIGLRVLLLFSIPNLSDDYARFLWDGHLTAAGIHPFLHTPVYFIEHQILPNGITPELFAKLNSQAYYTVYPPVCQAVFALAVWSFPNSILGGVFILKLFLLICEIGTIRLLGGMDQQAAKTSQHHWISQLSSRAGFNLGTSKGALLYALNPLLILEITGNCHFEGAMIFFLFAGIAALQKGNLSKGALYWALATASKMLPIMVLPILWRWLGFWKGLRFIAKFTGISLLLFAPLLAVLPNVLDSLDLYFRKFQFNASIYYLVREFGFSKIGWDIGEFSGPVLGGITLLGVLIIAGQTEPFTKNDSLRPLSTSILFALFLYLLLSATVQPWYLAVPLAFSFLTHWRFLLVWSGLVACSYSHYNEGGFRENFGWITLEYSLLAAYFLIEIWRRYKQKPASNSA